MQDCQQYGKEERFGIHTTGSVYYNYGSVSNGACGRLQVRKRCRRESPWSRPEGSHGGVGGIFQSGRKVTIAGGGAVAATARRHRIEAGDQDPFWREQKVVIRPELG